MKESNTENEIWVQIPGFKTYEYSNKKRIRTVEREFKNRILKSRIILTKDRDIINIRKDDGTRGKITFKKIEELCKNFLEKNSTLIEIGGSSILSLMEELIILNKEEQDHPYPNESDYITQHTILIEMIEDQMIELNLI